MSNQLHPKLKQVVIGRDDTITIEELKKLDEKAEKICENLDPKDFAQLPDGYVYTAKPYMLPIKEEDTVPFYRGEDDTPRLARCFRNNEKLLKDLYSAVIIKGLIYHISHPDVTQAKDTKNYILKEDGYNILTGGYAQFQRNLVYLPHRDGYANKKDVVKTADTGNMELKRDCYKFTNASGKKEYYRYRQLAPDAPNQIVRFEETVFPKANEITETRLGIELEFSSAIEASKKVLLNDKYRNLWNSVRDGSIPEKGTEFVSLPLTYEQIPHIEEFMNFVFEHGAKTNKSCGYHVHVGSPKMDFMGLTSIVLLCQNIEEDLFKLVPAHRRNNQYCKKLDESFRGFKKATSNDDESSVADIFYEGSGANYKSRRSSSKWSVGGKRHYWMSIDRFFRFRKEKEKRTVEFRMHHATEEPEEFIQFILLCYYIVEYALSVSKRKARSSTLHDILDFIRNLEDRQKVENLLVSKKAISI